MEKNVGKTDRIIRFVLAAVLIVIYLIGVGKILGLILILLAIVLVITGLTQRCPMHYITRTDTLHKKE